MKIQSPSLYARIVFVLALLAASTGYFVLFASAAHAQDQDTDTIITRTITAQPNDTFQSIARRELGKSGLAEHLASFNGQRVDETLFVGQTIRIPLYTPFEREFATVIFVKGEVTRGDTALMADDKVYMHELVVTGDNGFASLQFASGSVINIQPQSSAKLTRLNCLESDDSCLIMLDAAQGEVSSDVRRRDGQPTEFRIKTPYASAAVRGTLFEMNALPDTVILGVTEGDVLLNASGADVSLEQGFGSIAAPDQPPSDPIALLPAPVYRYIPTRAAAGDRVLWWALSDVEQYLVSLTVDPEGAAVVANFNRGDTANITVENSVAAGDYFLTVRGVDANGLKGFKSPTKITIAAIDESIEPVSTEVIRQGSEYLVRVVNAEEGAAPGYEIQVSQTPEFTDPLTVDTAETGAALFRLDSDKIYARARALLEPQIVSAFGEISESP